MHNFFAGIGAGNQSLTGGENTGVGSHALLFNTSGQQNTSIGSYALSANTSGFGNTAAGFNALASTVTSSNNTGIGSSALTANVEGFNNTAIGANANVASSSLTNATAIGANAIVGASNSLVLGGTGANAVKVGIGTTTPGATLDVANTFRVLGTPGPTSPATGSGIEMNYDSSYNNGIIQAYDYDTSTWGTLGINAAQVRFGGAFGSQVIVTGDMTVEGMLNKGGGSFKIDHPLDPKNKYLYHSFVESPDMKNIYDGVVTTDDRGFATVVMPEWFEALNRDFRYQLTIVGSGSWARARIAEEIVNNRFVIETDVPNMKVSWQVTGIRKDPYAEKHGYRWKRTSRRASAGPIFIGMRMKLLPKRCENDEEGVMNTKLIGLMIVLLCATAAYPAPPQTINYQGMLKSAGGPVNGAVSMTFKLYSSETDTLTPALWIETHPTVTVSAGKYSVVLGSVTPINLSFDAQYYLGVTVGTDEEMVPRQLLTTAPYAFRAIEVDNLSSSLTMTLDARYLNTTVPKATTMQIATLQWGAVNSISSTYAVGSTPVALAFDGGSMWVANSGDDTVLKLNPSTGALISQFTVSSHPSALAFDGSVEGNAQWVANYSSNTVQQIFTRRNPSTNLLEEKVQQTVPVGSGPKALASDAWGVWVANYGSNTVQRNLGACPPGYGRCATGSFGGPIFVGINPSALAYDGGEGMWVANSGSNSVQKIDVISETVVTTISVGINPSALASDGTSMWVANSGSNSVQKIDIVTGVVLLTINGFSSPAALAYDGTSIWVANYAGNSVQKINPSTGAASSSIPVGRGPSALAFDGTNMWVINSLDNNVQKLSNAGAILGVKSVGSEQLVDGAVGTAQLADGAVTDAKITGPISAAKLDLSGVVSKAGDIMTGALTVNGLISSGVITAAWV